jgi:U3 small nucleolar RNA-associated protein 6
MKKRKRFEYKMQRRTKEKEVYLQYIQYEMGVLKLIKLRREKKQIELGRDEIEKEIALRIYKLFRVSFERVETKYYGFFKMNIFSFLKDCLLSL